MNDWGVSVDLLVKTQTGEDDYGQPIFSEEWVTVENVLVGQPEADEVTNTLNLTGKKLDFVLGIPKGDTHDWEDTEVVIFGRKYRTVGATVMGIEKLVPTAWHKKVMVTRYEQDI